MWALARELGKWPWEVELMMPLSLMREYEVLRRMEAKEARQR